MSGLRLLVLTQAVDLDDPVLGFFHGWLRALSGGFSHIHVVCLREGRHDLPRNVVVHSLGKERGVGRIGYLRRFFGLVWRLRGEYDAVFVHMNPEYVVLGGLLWRLMGKRVYMWRNHWSRGTLTDIAVLLSHKTFCTSTSSYIAKYKKNIIMPVGIDTDTFKPVSGIVRSPRSILSLGRVAPSKNIHVMLEAFKILKEKNIFFSASIYGDALPKDAEYLAAQKRYVVDNNLSDRVTFYPGEKNADTPAIYSAHEVFVNASASGMFDKTIFEAIACGAVSIACSKDYGEFAGKDLVFEAGNAAQLATRIERSLAFSGGTELRERVAREHGLTVLAEKLSREITV